jgi:hypothetical protein
MSHWEVGLDRIRSFSGKRTRRSRRRAGEGHGEKAIDGMAADFVFKAAVATVRAFDARSRHLDDINDEARVY